jgi:putative (di)nucleoside polyphosphate hydrolase
VHEVIYFKKRVYLRALKQLAPILFPDGLLEPPPNIRRRRYNGVPHTRPGSP